MRRRHKHDWYDACSHGADKGTTTAWQECFCGRIHITMFKDSSELGNMVSLWLRFGHVVSMERDAARVAFRSAG